MPGANVETAKQGKGGGNRWPYAMTKDQINDQSDRSFQNFVESIDRSLTVVGINDVRDCKEYFNCRSTREFRAHIRRSTDLSRTAEGLLAFSETKNKESVRGRRRGREIWVWERSDGCTGWVDPRMKGCQKPNERCDCTCSPSPLPWLLRFFREIKIQRRDSSRRANWNILGKRGETRGGGQEREGVASTAGYPVDCYIDISPLAGEPFHWRNKIVESAAMCIKVMDYWRLDGVPRKEKEEKKTGKRKKNTPRTYAYRPDENSKNCRNSVARPRPISRKTVD